MPHQTFRVGDIQPNPFRDMPNYPVNREKVDALKASIHRTGYWENVLARIDANGSPELAYGHHRLIAFREALGLDYEVALIVHDLDDDTMFSVMSDENSEDWSASAQTDIQVVESLLAGIETGRLHFLTSAPTNSKWPLREAAGGLAYNEEMVADRLGWARQRVNAVFDVLDLGLTDKDVAGVSSSQMAGEVIKAAKTAGYRARGSAIASGKSDKEADVIAAKVTKHTARETLKQVAKGDITRKALRAEAQATGEAAAPRPAKEQSFHDAIVAIRDKVSWDARFNDPSDETYVRLTLLADHIDEVIAAGLAGELKGIRDVLRSTAKRATQWADRLDPALVIVDGEQANEPLLIS